MDKQITAALSKSALFSDVSREHRDRICAASSYINIEKNEMLFMEDDPADAMFLIDKGRVRIFKTSLQGKEHVLHFAEEGESFAEAALFGFMGYPANAQASRKSSIVRIPKDVFLKILNEDEEFRNSVFTSMALWLRRFADIIQSLTFKDVESRVISYIISQCSHEKGDCENGTTIDLGIEKSQLASYLGTIPETLSRALRRLQDSGMIIVNKSQITITDAEALIAGVSE